MPETSDYTPAWAERRRRRWGLVAAMLALPGWPFLASRVNDALGLAPEQGFAFLLPVLGFATVIALSVRYHAFPCPRCQRPPRVATKG